MRWIQIVVGLLLILVGLVWILQGINLLPGSFMTGHIEWAIIGAGALIAGALLSRSGLGGARAVR